MNINVSRYINKYLESNFKLYYDNLGMEMKMSFWNLISFDSEFKKYSVSEIVNEHKADKIIDLLIETFVQEKMSTFWVNEVSKYIKDYMSKNHPVYYGVLDISKLDKLVISMASNSLFKKYGLTAIKNGQANTLIDEAVNNYAQVKLTNVWANFEFFCEYIKRIVIENEYSNASQVNEQTLDSIVRYIAIDKSKENLADYSEFMNGSYDKTFLNNFDAYYDRISKDCFEHIMNVISNIKENNYGKYASEYIYDKVLEVIFKKHDIESITSGLCDDKIVEEYKSELFKLKHSVKSKVESILNSNLDIDMFKKISFSEIVMSLTTRILNGDEINIYHLLNEKNLNGRFEKIEKDILSYVSASARKNELSKYIEEYIKSNFFVYFVELKEEEFSRLVNILVTNPLFKNKNLVDVKDNKFRKKINVLIENVVKEQFSHVWNVVDTKRYIYDKIELMGVSSLTEADLMKISYEIFDILFINHKYTVDYIREGNADNLISSLLSRKTMEHNSIAKVGAPKRVKRVSKKRKMQRNVSMLLVVAALTTMLGFASYKIANGFKEGIDDISADFRYNSSSSQMFGDQFNIIYTKYADGFRDNTESVINVYNEYSKYGDVYGYLGFYESYKHINKDSLAIMDAMMSKIKNGISNGKYNTDMNIDSKYFLDFIYDRLIEMGCEEIKQEKYIDAINEYISVSFTNGNSNKTTMDVIREENKKLNDLILEITDMYHQYSSRYYDELCDLAEEKVISLSYGGRA